MAALEPAEINLSARVVRNDRYSWYIWLFFVAWWYLRYVVPSTTHHAALFLLAILVPVFPLVGILRLACHNLTPFPGPRLWGATRLPMFFYLCRGTLPQKINELHAKYGSVVRIAPNELSFIGEEAWAPIYNKPLHKPQLQKDPTQFVRPSSGAGGLFHELNDQVHGQVRRNFSHAFAEKTVLEQERIIQSYLTLFVSRIEDLGDKSADLCNLLNCLTFDIIGDLCFGQSFGSLESSTLHPWIKNIFDYVSVMVVFGMVQKFKLVHAVLVKLMHGEMRKAEHKHHSFVLDRVHKRLALETDRPDFITHVQKFLDKPTGISLPQLAQAVDQIVIGGSETTATVLSAALYHLLKTPTTLQALVSEIRSSFTSSTSITMKEINALTAAGELEHLQAVISEALRLYAPTPGNLTRVTPAEGLSISGWFVPGGSLVGVNLYSAGHSEHNFKNAEIFTPERWMKDAPEVYLNDKFKSAQPFSVGPRNCIGKNLANMQMRLILARLLHDFDIALDPVSEDWSKDMKIWGFYNKPQLMIKFTRVVKA